MIAEPPGSAVAGSPVPWREADKAATTLSPDYQRILSVLEPEAGREGMRCQRLAVTLGLAVVRRGARDCNRRRSAW